MLAIPMRGAVARRSCKTAWDARGRTRAGSLVCLLFHAKHLAAQQIEVRHRGLLPLAFAFFSVLAHSLLSAAGAEALGFHGPPWGVLLVRLDGRQRALRVVEQRLDAVLGLRVPVLMSVYWLWWCGDVGARSGQQGFAAVMLVGVPPPLRLGGCKLLAKGRVYVH